MNTSYTKGKAQTEVALEGTPFTLIILTYKRTNGVLATSVSAHRIEQCDGYRSMKCRIFQDYSKTWATENCRATAKAIEKQHESVLNIIDRIKRVVMDYYTSIEYLDKYGADFEIKAVA